MPSITRPTRAGASTAGRSPRCRAAKSYGRTAAYSGSQGAGSSSNAICRSRPGRNWTFGIEERWLSEVQLDQTDPASIQAAAEATAAHLGRPDILVNNAAWNIPIPFPDLDALTPEIWDRINGTNVRGPFLRARACAPYMRKQRQGRIVNISAFIGLTPAGSSIAHAVAKAALVHLTRCLAVALAPDITVNCVAPGLMEGTRMAQRVPPDVVEAMRQRAVLKRTTSLQDVADQVVTFCRADSVTGQVLVIDGGIHFH